MVDHSYQTSRNVPEAMQHYRSQGHDPRLQLRPTGQYNMLDPGVPIIQASTGNGSIFTSSGAVLILRPDLPIVQAGSRTVIALHYCHSPELPSPFPLPPSPPFPPHMQNPTCWSCQPKLSSVEYEALRSRVLQEKLAAAGHPLPQLPATPPPRPYIPPDRDGGGHLTPSWPLPLQQQQLIPAAEHAIPYPGTMDTQSLMQQQQQGPHAAGHPPAQPPKVGFSVCVGFGATSLPCYPPIPVHNFVLLPFMCRLPPRHPGALAAAAAPARCNMIPQRSRCSSSPWHSPP